MFPHIDKEEKVLKSCSPLLNIILRRILDARFGKRFATLYTRAAFAAMVLATFVARPRLAVVNAQRLTTLGNIALRDIGIR